MVLRTVRLDDETEKVLKQVTKQTGWSVSTTLKRGVLVLQDEVSRRSQQSAFDIYRRLDLGPGGYAIAPTHNPSSLLSILPTFVDTASDVGIATSK